MGAASSESIINFLFIDRNKEELIKAKGKEEEEVERETSQLISQYVYPYLPLPLSTNYHIMNPGFILRNIIYMRCHAVTYL